MREYRVLKALQDTAVPVPRVYAACDDPKYIGAPFYLMEYMRGDVIRADGNSISPTRRALRRTVSESMIDLLIALQQVDWRAAGLEGFGRPDGYLPRQLKRWVDQLERTIPHTRPLPVMNQVARLAAGANSRSPPADHRAWRLQTRQRDVESDRPPKPIAVFDWEMSTIGDPLADFGWMLSYWPDPADDPVEPGHVDACCPSPGFLTRREMLDRYEAKTGRKMTRLPVLPGVRDFQARDHHGRQLLAASCWARPTIRCSTRMKERVPALADARGRFASARR